MAKNPKTPQPPEIQAKSLGQIQDEAVSANISSLPKLLAAYQQYGPEFSKILTQQYIDAQKRAPEAYPELYEVLNPLTKAVSGRLNDINQGGIPEGVLTPYSYSLRNAQRLRGFIDSPISAYEEANYLMPYAEEYKKGVINEGQDFVSTLNTLRSVPGGDVSLDTLGLTPPSIAGSMSLEGQTLQPFREDARQQNFTTQQAYRRGINESKANSRNGIARTVGGAAGAVAAPFIGLDPFTGAQAGSAIGGTFF